MKLIDADALIARLKKDPLFCLVEKYGITGVIEAEPTIDAVEVVRCFECKALMLKAEKPRYMCCKFNGLTDPKPNDFCSYGERRNDEADLCRDGTRDARSV